MTTVAEFKIGKILGKGTFSQVKLVTHIPTKQLVPELIVGHEVHTKVKQDKE